MDRPSELFDREAEWANLVDFVQQPGPGIRLALVRGRRRQGKSFLLRRLTEGIGGFYYQALEQEQPQALAAMGAAMGEYLGVPGGRLAFATWDEALSAIADIRRGGGPAAVVIDELPYLLAHSPELPSLLQRYIDSSRDRGPEVRLIVCGSALSVMASLLEGAHALRGRATHDLPVGTFDFRTAARFWGIKDPRTAFHVHAVIGGTPGYHDLIAPKAPARLADFGRWLEKGVLNPASAMFREDDYLLTEERSFSDRALYHAVVGAIAAGHTSQGAIAAAVGREGRAVQHPLRALEEAGFVDRDDDLLRDRRPIYRLADPIVRFHHVVTRADLARFEDRRFAEAWPDAQARFSTHVLGPHFEKLARDFTSKFASSATTGGVVARVGSAVIRDQKARAQHQLDIVATMRMPNGSSEVVAIGEAKHTSRVRTVADLDRLAHIRAMLVSRGAAPATTKLLLFSANGFDHNLSETSAGRDDVELIDLERMYRGD
ncbi:MAG: AAA family ATPase [Acidimicrobiales bacterium]